MGLSKSLKPLPTVPRVGGLFFPQRKALGLDPRESTPGFKHQLVVLNAELRSLKRAAMVAERVLGQKVSPNTIERICLDVAADVLAAERRDWKSVITGEITAPSVAIVEFDGGRIRTRKTGCGPGVHLEASGWNETKNAIFVSALSTVSDVDPQPQPPRCFLDRNHVAKLSESTKICEKPIKTGVLRTMMLSQLIRMKYRTPRKTTTLTSRVVSCVRFFPVFSHQRNLVVE